ncbi:MAG: cysteine--tRNA ligase [Alphaproteobacteria bacterium]|nr:cysteine--tRNA ligase [Alphaproteobacteria bacterium]
MNFTNPKLEIKLFDTLTNKIQILKTIEKNVLKMYVCGPTVYDRPHLGNARSIVVYDLFYRFFLQVFEKVIFVRNITDVDDKINDSAKEQNISIQQLTTRIIEYFYHDIDALKVLKPTFEPKVTENIPEIIDLIQKLIDNNHAYIANKHVLFDVSSCADYGKLSNRKIDELISGARVEIADYKKTPLDFVLWKPSDADDDPSSIFDSPWGKGRPGWHIECSAMSLKFLGENFDIHGGGADLQFPHHENEIAQSCSAHRGSNYASYWVHNGFLTVEGEKMSKSLKNFVTVFDLLNRGVKGTTIRLMLLSSHYRKPFDFNQKILEDSQKTLEKFHEVLSINDVKIALNNSQTISPEIMEFLADDLNFSKVIAFIHNQLKTLKTHKTNDILIKYISNLSFLGILDESFIVDDSAINNDLDLNFVNEQINLRQKLKAEKKYAEADEIRKNLLNLGVVIEDKPNNQSAFHFIRK